MSAPPPPPYQQLDPSKPGPPQYGQMYPPPQPPGQQYHHAPTQGNAYPPAGPPPAAYAPPPMTYVAAPPSAASVTVVQTGVGNCPNCRAGYFTDHYGVCAILLAVLCFPIGVLCCLAMRERQCTNCGYTTG